MFGNVKQASTWARVGVGATVYWGSRESRAQLHEVTAAFAHAHELGMFTMLWCYLRNDAFKTKDGDYHTCPPISPARPITSA